MRKFTLAVAAASLAMPVAMPAPAIAKSDGYYKGKTWRDRRAACGAGARTARPA